MAPRCGFVAEPQRLSARRTAGLENRRRYFMRLRSLRRTQELLQRSRCEGQAFSAEKGVTQASASANRRQPPRHVARDGAPRQPVHAGMHQESGKLQAAPRRVRQGRRMHEVVDSAGAERRKSRCRRDHVAAPAGSNRRSGVTSAGRLSRHRRLQPAETHGRTSETRWRLSGHDDGGVASSRAVASDPYGQP